MKARQSGFQAVPDRWPGRGRRDHPPTRKSRSSPSAWVPTTRPGVHPFGKGRILTGADRSKPIKLGEGLRAWTFYDGLHSAAMDRLGIAPAFSYSAKDPDTRLFFFQRNADGADVFFVANALRAGRPGRLHIPCNRETDRSSGDPAQRKNQRRSGILPPANPTR